LVRKKSFSAETAVGRPLDEKDCTRSICRVSDGCARLPPECWMPPRERHKWKLGVRERRVCSITDHFGKIGGAERHLAPER
jgi:hypothetical protein